MQIFVRPRVVLPAGFVALKYPGYFWNVDDQKLYTMKQPAGVLRQLPVHAANHWSGHMFPYYRISHNGRRRTISTQTLIKYSPIESEIPVK